MFSDGEIRSHCVTSIGQPHSDSILEPHGESLTSLCCLAIEIWEWCLAREIMICAEYLPGMENVAANWESRHHNNSSNWQLSLAVFDAVNKSLDPFSIDLFSSRINHQLPIYCSGRPDPEAISVDTFLMPWREELPICSHLLSDWQSAPKDSERVDE